MFTANAKPIHQYESLTPRRNCPPQEFAQFHIGERRLSLMSYKPLA